MKKVMVLILVLWWGMTVYAQADDVADIPVWDVVQKCVTLNYPIIPQSRWDFDGTIISQNLNGIHAIRSDMETGYYIALMSDRHDIRLGSFSPDGKWFIYPISLSEPTRSNLLKFSYYHVDLLRFVTTSPHTQTQDIAWQGISWDFTTPWYRRDGYTGVFNWLDNEKLIAGGGSINHVLTSSYSVIEFIDGQFVEVEHFPNASQPYTPPVDVQRFRFQFDDENTMRTIVVPTLKFASDQRFALPLLDISEKYHTWMGEFLDRYHLIDLENEQVIDFCLSNKVKHDNMIWSPDGETIAFLYDGYLVLLDVETWQTQILDYQTSTLQRWLADEELSN